MKQIFILKENINNTLSNVSFGDTLTIDAKDKKNKTFKFSVYVVNIDNDYIYIKSDYKIDIDKLRNKLYVVYDKNDVEVANLKLIGLNINKTGNSLPKKQIDTFMQTVNDDEPFTIQYEENGKKENINLVITNSTLKSFSKNNQTLYNANYSNGVFTVVDNNNTGNQLSIGNASSPVSRIVKNKNLKIPNNSNTTSNEVSNFLSTLGELNQFDTLEIIHKGDDALELFCIEKSNNKITFTISHVDGGFPMSTTIENNKDSEFVLDTKSVSSNTTTKLLDFEAYINNMKLTITDIKDYNISTVGELSKK